MAIFEQGAFQQNQNDTPESIARRRAMIRDAMMNYGSASNVGEGVGQLLNGIATGVQMRGLDRAEQAGVASGQAAQSKIFDAMMGGAKSPASEPAAMPTSSAPSTISGLKTDIVADVLNAGPQKQGGTDWLKYNNQGATRNRPLDEKLVNSLSFLPELGVQMEVFSGGQAKAGEGPRTGSVRHDHGGAGDVFFYKDGRKLDWANPQDVPLFQDIVRKAKANGVTGFGAGDGYMQPGSMHIGFGTPSVWGAGGRGANAPSWLREAFNGQSSPQNNTQVASLDPSVGMAYSATSKPTGAAQALDAMATQSIPQNAPQMRSGGSGLDVWQGRANQGTATDGTQLTRLPNGDIQRTNRFGVTERMSPDGGSAVASGGARPQMQPQQVAQAGPMQTPMQQATPSQPQQGGVNLQAMLEAAQNPFTPPEVRKMALDFIQNEQMKQTPEYQQVQKMKDLEYQKSQLEIQNMKNPPAKWDVVTGKDGSVFRINPQTGEHETIYGPQTEPLKPTGDIQEYEYAKKQGFTGTFPEYQQQMKKAGAQSINIDQKAEGQFDKTLAEKQAASFDAMATEGMNAKADIAVIGELRNLLKGQGGMLTGLSGALAKYGIGGEGVGDLQAADALINKLIPSQRAPGSGSMSDRDVEMFRSSLPSLWKSPGGNQIILNTMQSLAQYKQAQGDIAQRVMIGEIDRKEAVKMLRELPNPLEGFRANMSMQPNAAPQTTPQAAPDATTPPQGVDADTWKYMTPEERALWN